MNKALKVILGLKIFSAVVCCFTMFTYSHNIRQLDTMGVSLRYWLRWTAEPELFYPLLPAVLNAGDYYGLAVMEFPILNLLTAPFFAFGIESGRILARLFLLALTLALVFFHHKAWREQKVMGLNVEWASWLMIIFSVTTLYVERFMPDLIAFLLASLAVGISWQKPRWALSLVLAAIGLLIKPPVVTVFVILFLKSRKELISNTLQWALPAIMICLSYYLLALPMLREMTDYPGSFAVGLRHPWVALMGFFSNPTTAIKVMTKYIFTAHTVWPLLAWVFFKAIKQNHKRPLLILGLIFLQYFVAATLVGNAGYDHNYYFIGSAFLAALILKEALQENSKYLSFVLIALIMIYTLERGYYNLRPISKGHILQECKVLRDYIPADEVKINTFQQIYSHLGVCMGRIQNSKSSRFAVYMKSESPSFENRRLVAQTENLYLFEELSAQ
jgi:hypothetical protein